MTNVEEALDQAAADIESGKTGGDSEQTIEGQDHSTNTGDGKGLGKEVPPELKEKEKELLRAFHEKTQALAEDRRKMEAETTVHKQDAQAFYDLAKQDWFKAAVEAEKSRRQGRAVEITPEAFETIKNDPRAFADYLAKRDEAVAGSLKSQFKAELEKLGKSQQELVTSREKDSAAREFGEDFTVTEKAGELKAYLDEGLSYERAYKLYCQDQGKVAGAKKEAAPITQKKGGIVERSGMPQVRGGPVIKAKNLSEALDRAFELAAKGVKDYRFEKT